MSSKETNLKVLGYFEASGNAMEQATKLATAVEAETREAVKQAKVIVAELQRDGILQAFEADGALAKLSSHTGAVEAIGSMLKYAREQKAEYEKELAVYREGKPGGEKTAAAVDNKSRNRLFAERRLPNFIGKKASVDSDAESTFDRILGVPSVK